jgi:hypothetical protein
VLIDMVAAHVMRVTVVQIIDMAVMTDGSVPAVRPAVQQRQPVVVIIISR